MGLICCVFFSIFRALVSPYGPYVIRRMSPARAPDEWEKLEKNFKQIFITEEHVKTIKKGSLEVKNDDFLGNMRYVKKHVIKN